MTAALEGGEWSAARLGRTLTPGRRRYPFYRRLYGPQVWPGWAENPAPTGIRSPDRPARSSVAIPTELPGPLSLSIQYIVYVGVCVYIYIYIYIYIYHTRSSYSDSLQTGRSGDRIPVRARFSAHLQTGPGGPPILLYNGYLVFSVGKAAGACRRPPTPSSADVKERVEIYLYSPSGPLWPVLGWPLYIYRTMFQFET